MKFTRVYLASDGHGHLGSISDKKTGIRKPDPVRQIWLNIETSSILDRVDNNTWDFYNVGSIPFGTSFRPRFFKGRKEEKSDEQLTKVDVSPMRITTINGFKGCIDNFKGFFSTIPPEGSKQIVKELG